MSEGAPDTSPFADLPPAALLLDQRRRWQRGERVRVETYLERQPHLASDTELLLDLIYNEFLLRERHGETPRREEYLERFPHLADPLRLQFEMDRAMQAGGLLPSAPGRTTVELGQSGDTERPADQPTLPALPGYETLGLLGSGGMGVVYKARQVKADRLVALKMIGRGGNQGRFQTEIEAVARLQHPNVVPIYEVGEHHGTPFFSMELVDGGGLDKKLAGTPLPPREAASLAETLARAMHYTHQRGILHRDLKPANVLLTSDGVPKISDFGLARRLENESSLTQTGVPLGTPCYMAPEQAAGQPAAVGPLTDVYALGAILYECLTGRPPFRAATIADTLDQVRFTEPVPPRQLQPPVPRDLETVCLKCLRKEPAKRYASALELADDLRRFLNQEPIRARPVGAAERAWRWCKRKPAVAALAGALVLALVVGFGLVTWQWRQASVNFREAEQQRRQAEDNFTEAKTQRERAEENLRESEANFKLAREAVDQCFTTASEHPLLQKEGMQPARELLLRSALRYYQNFIEKRRGDPTVREELARNYMRVGIIIEMVGSKEEALEALQQARDLFGELAAADPNVREYQSELARTHHAVGVLQRATGKPKPALESFEKTRQILDGLVRAGRATEQDQVMLALTWNNLGLLRRATGDPATAQRCYEEALTVLTNLGGADRHPDRANLLAKIHNNFGLLYHARRNLPDALRSYAEACSIRERLIREYPTVAEYQCDLATTYANAGLVHGSAGRLKEELSAYEQASGMMEKLVQSNPAVTNYRNILARMYSDLGMARRNDRQLSEALRAYERARDLQEELLAANPTVSLFRADLARTWIRIGDLHRSAGDQAAALKAFEESLALREKLVQQEGSVTDWQNELAESHVRIARLHRDADDQAASLRSFERALSIRQQLAKANPTIPQYQQNLALVYQGIGGQHMKSGATDQGLQFYELARAIQEKLSRADPQSGKYRDELAITWHQIGNLRRDRNEPALALEAYQQARTLWEELRQKNPRSAAYLDDLRLVHKRLAETLLQLDRPDEAAAACLERAKLWPRDPNQLYAVACDIARCVPLVARGKPVRSPAETAQADRYAAQALDVLRRAVDAGYRNAAQLQTEPALQSLRGRDEFKELLLKVEKPPG